MNGILWTLVFAYSLSFLCAFHFVLYFINKEGELKRSTIQGAVLLFLTAPIIFPVVGLIKIIKAIKGDK